jgi:hypothetical protein
MKYVTTAYLSYAFILHQYFYVIAMRAMYRIGIPVIFARVVILVV